MRIGSKFILKLTAFLVLGESIYALIWHGMFQPMAICGAIASLFATNSAHEHIKTYLDKKENE